MPSFFLKHKHWCISFITPSMTATVPGCLQTFSSMKLLNLAGQPNVDPSESVVRPMYYCARTKQYFVQCCTYCILYNICHVANLTLDCKKDVVLLVPRACLIYSSCYSISCQGTALSILF